MAELLPALTVIASGLVRALNADGTISESVATAGGSAWTLLTSDLEIDAGGIAVATVPVTMGHDLIMNGGLAALPQGFALSGASELSGFGQISGPFAGGAASSIAASSGVLTLGDSNHSAGFAFDGTAMVPSGSELQLLDADAAALGSATTLAAGARLASLHGVALGGASVLSALGPAEIDGAFANYGVVNGPTAQGDLLASLDDVTGAGSYTGNVRFSDGFSPGLSPAQVSFENVSFDGTSELLMELGGTSAGNEYDQILFSGTAELGGALSVALIGGFTPAIGDVFDLLVGGTLGGTFDSISLPAVSSGSWQVDQTSSGLSLVVIPEPSSALLLGAGLAGVVLASRRRSRLLRSSIAVAVCALSGFSPARATPLDPGAYASLGTLTIPSGSLTFNTDTLAVSGAFSGTGVLQSQGGGNPDIAVFTFDSIDIAAAVSVTLTGSRPLALLSQADATIGAALVLQGAGGSSGNSDIAGVGGAGALGGGGGGSARTTAVPGAGLNPGFGPGGGGGGGGGGFGGRGGAPGPTTTGVSGPVYGDLSVALQGGSGGGSGNGIGGVALNGPGGGAGAGALEFGALGALTLASVNAGGGGGGGTGPSFGAGVAFLGAGGGSGGGLLLHGTGVEVTVAILARGGGGSLSSGPGTLAGGGGGGGRVRIETGASYVLGEGAPSVNVAGGPSNASSNGIPGSPGQVGLAELVPAP